MNPLIAVAIAVFPETLQIVSSSPSDATVGNIVKAVKEATGADTAEAARATLADPAKSAAALDLRVRLAQIVGDTSTTSSSDSAAAAANMAQARETMVSLAKINDPLANTPAIISYIVVVSFVLLIFLLATGCATALREDGDKTIAQLSNICIGALAASFATVLNFWLGSSLGSRRKDTQAAQESTVEQNQKLAAGQGQK